MEFKQDKVYSEQDMWNCWQAAKHFFRATSGEKLPNFTEYMRQVSKSIMLENDSKKPKKHYPGFCNQCFQHPCKCK